jgi:UDP-N-acetylmuramoylalanine--D-glutamate ligase
MNVTGLHIAVLGAGESGESAAKLLRELGARVTVLDSGKPEVLLPKIERLAALGIEFIAGEAANTDEAVYALGVLSPGIDPAVPLVKNFRANGCELIGELEFADRVCGRPVVGITGTNGKTTTTQIVETMLNGAGVSTVACGNISPAFSAKVAEAKALDVVTVEISSFQLEEIRQFRPKVAVWLGFAPDHLDRYPDMESYYAAKVRIFENQTPEDFAVVNLRDQLPPLKAKRITFSAYQTGGDFELRDGVIHYHGKAILAMSDTNLRGHHNAENIMAALGVGVALGVETEKLVAPICAYRALPHRCELVAVIDGVDYVNDSKATNLDSLEKAIAGETRGVVLIAGGKDKGFEFDSIAKLVAEKCRAAILIGEMAGRIERSWAPAVRCINVGYSLESAVAQARSLAQSGDMVLFSPGTSSFDMFKNYADRGNQFRQLVQKLQTTTTPSQP